MSVVGVTLRDGRGLTVTENKLSKYLFVYSRRRTIVNIQQPYLKAKMRAEALGFRPFERLAVGWALRRNPSPGAEIPCHRVVNREGRLAPAFAFGGPGAQRDLLEAEGVPFFADGRVDLKRCAWCGPKEGGSV